MIFDVIGTPKPEEIQSISGEKARRYVAAMPPKGRIDFRNRYKNADPLAIELLHRLLTFSPEERLTAEEVRHFVFG